MFGYSYKEADIGVPSVEAESGRPKACPSSCTVPPYSRTRPQQTLTSGSGVAALCGSEHRSAGVLIALTIAIKDIPRITADDSPVAAIMHDQLGPVMERVLLAAISFAFSSAPGRW